MKSRTTRGHEVSRSRGLKGAALAALSLIFCGGCQSFQPNAFTAEFADAARQVATSVGDQAVWERVLARLDGQVIEPGVEGYAGVLYVAGGKLTGVSGQITIEGDGNGSGALSADARAVIVELGKRRPDLLRELIAAASQALATTDAPTTQPGSQ